MVIISKVTKDTEEEAAAMKLLNPTFYYKFCHPSLSLSKTSREVTRSKIKIRLLTDTYTQQTSKVTFEKADSSVCQMCESVAKDTSHFLLECSYPRDYRKNI